MNTIHRTALAAAALLALAPAAQATATATATLTNFHYQLFDLDPTDGITPAVTFGSGDLAQVNSNASPDNYATQDYHGLSGALGAALSVSSLLGANSASSSTTAGNPVGLGIGPGATATATAAGANSLAYAGGYALITSFTLTPHTLLVLTAGTFGVAATATQLGDYAYVTSEVELQDSTTGQVSYGQAYAYVQTDGTAYSNLPAAITASFANLTGSAGGGYAYAYAYAYVSGVAAVPEPAAGALFLSGLTAIGVMARRRRSR